MEIKRHVQSSRLPRLVEDLKASLEDVSPSTTCSTDFYLNITHALRLQEEKVACDAESDSDLFKAFEMFDKNRDGLICNKELMEALTRLGLWDDKSNMDVKSMIKAYVSIVTVFLISMNSRK
nr:probable calcium-binding protein CML44 [Tanacetum cinerariifolium]